MRSFIVQAYFNRDRNILPFNFRDTSCVANILQERFREHSVIQLSRNGAERDTAAWKINVRGIAHAHRWHRARTYGGVVFFFFFFPRCAANIRRA